MVLNCHNIKVNYQQSSSRKRWPSPCRDQMHDELLALNIESFSVQPGTHTAILGANGAGKSTLLKAVSGDVSYRGELNILGEERRSWQSHHLARYVAVLPQNTQLSFSFTVREVVGLGLFNSALNLGQQHEVMLTIMQQVDVANLAERSFLTLSGGQQQRVLFAKALCQIASIDQGAQQYSQKLLLLDEPIAALDVFHQHQLLRSVAKITQRSGTVISVLHDLNLAARYCDRLVLMHQGQIIADGTPEMVLTEDNISGAYGYKSSVIRHPEQGYLMVS